MEMRKGTVLKLVGATLVVLAMDQALGMATSIGVNLGIIPDDWTDYVLEEVLLGSRGKVIFLGMDAIVFAPLFEELAFRGVLYPALRSRMSPLAAALLSGIIFGAIHGYALAGFIAVATGGMVYALIYERTRSLVPCMLAHAIHNSLVMASLIAYRPLVV